MVAMKHKVVLLVLGGLLAGLSTGEALAPPGHVIARDTPGDGGGSITVRWDPVAGVVSYRVEAAADTAAFASVGDAAASETQFVHEGVRDGQPYRYRVVAIDAAGDEAVSEPSAPAASSPQWFDGKLIGVAIAILGLVAVVLWYIRRARRGEHLFVRRIAGLEAVDEAVGRATEMGRPVLYVPGTGYMSDIGTVASMNLLGEIAKKTAEYNTPIMVPVRDPVVYTVAREVVKGAYIAAGRPDAHDPGSVYFVVEQALAYAAAVSGTMVRDRPATNFFMGPFYAESLILAETGAATGAIQIAGSDQVTQLPFFVVACDYTLIGEELYAASAYLAREPLMLGALKGQDVGKLVFMVILVVGTILSILTGRDFTKILSTTGY
jgi:hypothetical protein